MNPPKRLLLLGITALAITSRPLQASSSQQGQGGMLHHAKQKASFVIKGALIAIIAVYIFVQQKKKFKQAEELDKNTRALEHVNKEKGELFELCKQLTTLEKSLQQDSKSLALEYKQFNALQSLFKKMIDEGSLTLAKIQEMPRQEASQLEKMFPKLNLARANEQMEQFIQETDKIKTVFQECQMAPP